MHIDSDAGPAQTARVMDTRGVPRPRDRGLHLGRSGYPGTASVIVNSVTRDSRTVAALIPRGLAEGDLVAEWVVL